MKTGLVQGWSILDCTRTWTEHTTSVVDCWWENHNRKIHSGKETWVFTRERETSQYQKPNPFSNCYGKRGFQQESRWCPLLNIWRRDLLKKYAIRTRADHGASASWTQTWIWFSWFCTNAPGCVQSLNPSINFLCQVHILFRSPFSSLGFGGKLLIPFLRDVICNNELWA